MPQIHLKARLKCTYTNPHSPNSTLKHIIQKYFQIKLWTLTRNWYFFLIKLQTLTQIWNKNGKRVPAFRRRCPWCCHQCEAWCWIRSRIGAHSPAAAEALDSTAPQSKSQPKQPHKAPRKTWNFKHREQHSLVEREWEWEYEPTWAAVTGMVKGVAMFL